MTTELIIRTNLQEAYDEQYTSAMTIWRELGGKYKARRITDLCVGHIAPTTVLEVGAGEGSILKYLSEWNFGEILHAVEISRSGIAAIEARQISRLISVQSFNGYELPFEDNSIDLIILSHVLEHVEYPRLLLRELRRVARYILIEVPCDFSFEVDQQVNHFLSYGHINIFLPPTLRFLLKTEGFIVVGDILALIADEVNEYSIFVNLKVPSTFVNHFKFRVRSILKRLRFQVASPVGKQLLADSYTVLCQKSDQTFHVLS